ncbi:MAG: response regulator transcription factor [Gemmatimonadales bacterium]
MTAHGSILVVEDNVTLAMGLEANLQFEGYTVRVVGDGQEAVTLLAGERYDLVVLDLMLPGLDGMEVLSRLRASGSRTAVLILTAKGAEAEKVSGLRHGADDYLTKPFGIPELLARVEALLRRSRVPPTDPAAEDRGAAVVEGPYRFSGVEVDMTTRTVRRTGQEVPMTPIEFELMVALIRRGGTLATRLELLKEVWRHPTPVPSRTVDTHMGELRRKLEENPAAPRHFLTVRKAGYRFQP